jgi:hypothetical protein
MTKASRGSSALPAGRIGAATRRVVSAGLTAALLVVAASAARAQLGADRPTARQVNDVLLPYLIAQKRHPIDGFELPASDVWWAWRSQYDMSIDRPLTNVMHLAAHNAFNALGDGYGIVPAIAPNQILGVTQQLEFGARLVEIDVHDPDGFLEVFHWIDAAGENDREFRDVLAQISRWMNDNFNEIVFIDIEDATDDDEGDTPETSIDRALRQIFGDPDDPGGASLLFTPAMRAELGRWPSRREMLELGTRVVVFAHRNDTEDGRFGTPVRYVDAATGHVWYGTELAFRVDGADGTAPAHGNLIQFPVQDIASKVASAPSLLENESYFLTMQSDGIDQIPPSLLDYFLRLLPQIVDLFFQFDAERATPDDARWASRNNVNFLKLDFLFGHDEDADLGSNSATYDLIPYSRDDVYEIEDEGDRGKLLRFAIWSWAEGDPAVQRQIFQDLTPGDGTGTTRRRVVSDLMGSIGHPEFSDELAERGAAARSNGRDFAVQRTLDGNPDRRWVSVGPAGGEALDAAAPHPFALRSTERDGATGRYRWKLSTHRGSADEAASIPDADLNGDDGFRYVFAAPGNGRENEDLFEARRLSGSAEAVWINANDADRNGQWAACPCVPRLARLVVMEPTIDEGSLGRLSLLFEDADPFDRHTVSIDWGDGTPPDVIALAAGERALEGAEHLYVDDDPTGTSADGYTISVELHDGINPPTSAQRTISVRNLDPSIDSLASTSTAERPADEGEPVELVAEFSDAGALDVHEASVAWGDGTVTAGRLVEADGAGAFSASHAYVAGGLYDVVVAVSDDDLGGASATTTAFVTGVGLHAGVLQVVGDADRNVVTLNRESTRSLMVHADFLADARFRRFDPALVERIEIYACPDDHVKIAGNVDDIEILILPCSGA